MAINYNRVNWDTTKYVNPTNMNNMDAGIKAACDGVDRLDGELATTNQNVTDLETSTDEKISAINNDLSHLKSGGRSSIMFPINSVVTNGVTFKQTAPNELTATGTATANAYTYGTVTEDVAYEVPAGTYTFFCDTNTNCNGFIDYFVGGVKTQESFKNRKVMTFSSTTKVFLRVQVLNGATVNGYAKLMCAKGEVAEYEPYYKGVVELTSDVANITKIGKYDASPVIYKAINTGATQGVTFDTGLPTDRSFICKVTQIEQNTIREYICGKRYSGAGFASNCNYVTENTNTKTIMLTSASTNSDRWFFEYMDL